MRSLLCITMMVSLFQLNAQTVPTFEQVLSLKNVGGAAISPDGSQIVYTIQSTDWNENRFDTEIWILKEGKKPIQLTSTSRGSSVSPAFSPDGQWVAFLADRNGKTQIQAIRTEGGEARPVTREEESVNSFEWNPAGTKFIFLKPEKEDKNRKEVEKRYGGFEQDDKEYTLSHLWEINFNPEARDPSELPCYETVDSLKAKSGCIEWEKARRLTKGKFTVTAFQTSPDGKSVAFSHQPDPMITTFMRSDISVLDISNLEMTKLVINASTDGLETWSPDSQEILYTSSLSDTVSNYYTNTKLFAVNLKGKSVRQLAKDFDENFGGFQWRNSGIYFSSYNKTKRPLYKIDPTSGVVSEFMNSPTQIAAASFAKAADKMVLIARGDDQLNEVWLSSESKPNPIKISDLTGQLNTWTLGKSEVISWKSKDGAIIEGILHKPKDYDPSKKYPLMVIIHGGPTGIDTPTPLPYAVYPIVQWLNKGCLVLRPNYRGSAGYGEKFRSLNVKNLGVGDAWDVLSGVDYLEKKGMIDKSKMGCMGWSQGGYISAFLTTTSDIFKAISVGAGISDWMTYYVSTDIHPFTRQYLKATPWSDEAIYKKTSPMNYINQAKTPTLIQHGEFDRRVPISNAYQLLQGLRDKGVKTELIVYKGFGHGINKPKERLAATWHNWQWFNKYVWGENVELPVGEKK